MSAEPKSAAVPQAKGKLSAHYMVVAAMLSAVAFALQFLEFSIPLLIPDFVRLDISDLPALLGSFSLGPACGVIVALLKNVLKLLVKGTYSAGIGELCNFALNAAFAVTAGLIYKFNKNRKGAIAGSLAGALVMGLISVPLNYFLVYPVYAVGFGGMELIVGAYQTILPGVDGILECLVVFNLPFTIVKGLLCSLLCFLIYKPLSPLLHGNR